MPLNKSEFSSYIRAFNFRELFNEMGWNNDRTAQPIVIDSTTFTLKGVAEKSGFRIFVCDPGADGLVPDYNTRKKIEAKLRKLFQEHLIIFQDTNRTQQIWLFVARQSGKPTRVTETWWNKDQEPELLFQRASGVFFELDEEDNITIVDVTQRVAANFDQNNERVTRRFYERFTAEHNAFASFVTGIDDHIDDWNRAHSRKADQKENLNKQWFVSLMLNRLMFCYFIQKKGFLNKNNNYLRDKLRECRERKGKNKYYSFYRNFLVALFHEGFGMPEHSSALKAEIGRVPYLNGGLFDEHQLEKDFDGIEIDDDAFEKIFEFFDQYEWHLDTRHTASGRDINPDVIGYIFEKYINERAAMGAYYTKEDITDYISKNCVLPFLFDETERNYLKAFGAKGEIWERLRKSGDRYIYDAVKKGVELELPENIAVGVDTTKPGLLERRKDWNRRAPDAFALPTEIWREVIDRRRRYAEAKAKIENGEIADISDFITYNLNIRQFAQDVVENTTDPKFLEHYYKALSSVTILDPTCGSGAFLFAAMNILEPLYEACLQRMRSFIEDEERTNLGDKRTFGHKFPYFREVLEDVQHPAHPNLSYFIYKSIILRNLYGVDIMKEAVEVAKLRLFLKLVATVDADYAKPNLGLEPLPDIDFNIRAGNTLIGYVSQKQIDELAALLITADDKKNLLEKCDIIARTFRRYKEIQLSQETEFEEFKNAKDELNTRLRSLNHSLDRTLFKQSYEGMDYDQWKETHQPFHWFAKVYEIVSRGGFDVVIGNPPYIELRSVAQYKLNGYTTIGTRNLYPTLIERGTKLIGASARLGMIVPVSSVSTQGYSSLQDIVFDFHGYFSNFDDRPSHLFEGLEHIQLTIHLLRPADGQDPKLYASECRRWNKNERDTLFHTIEYAPIPNRFVATSLPKISTELEASILEKVTKQRKSIAEQTSSFGNHPVYYSRKVHNFLQVLDFVPEVFDGNGKLRPPTELKELTFIDGRVAEATFGTLNSSLFRWFVNVFSDCRHVNKRETEGFRIELNAIAGQDEFAELANELSDCLRSTSEYRMMKFKHDTLKVQCIIPKFSKPIIDKIDKVLAKHYGFTEEELDFIVNYDIKYRMGIDLNDEDEQ